MGVIINGKELESMTHDGVEVQTWTHNGVEVYSAGKMVTYMVDSGISYQEKVKKGQSCLAPTTFTPSKSGWIFVGWREDKTASGNVLGSKLMERSPITLYAVFRQVITLSYNGNGATGGSTEAQTGTRYFNSGNYANPSFILRNNGFSRSGWGFYKWALNSVGGTQYSVGSNITLNGNATLYALWHRSSPVTPLVNLVKTSSDWYSSNDSAPDITVSGGNLAAHWDHVSWCGITIDAWTSNQFDLSGYNTAVITCYSDADTKEMKVGFGTSRGTFSVSGSPALRTTTTITLDISSLSSAYFGVHWNASENPNYSTARDYGAAIKKIELRP